MHKACAIDQDIGRTEFADHRGRQRVDLRARAHIKLEPLIGFQLRQLVGCEIGRNDAGAFGQKGLGNRRADALPRGGDERQLAFKTFAHAIDPRFNANLILVIVARDAFLRDALIFDCRLEHHAVGKLVDHGALNFLPWCLARWIFKAAALFERRPPPCEFGF